MNSDDPAMPRCVLINEREHGDLGIGHADDTFWRIPRDHTGRLRHTITAALTACDIDRGTDGPGHGDGSPTLPQLPPSVAIWRGADGTLTINLVADTHHPVSPEHTTALRHAIITALRARTTSPERNPEPPWPTTGPSPSWRAPVGFEPTLGSSPGEL